MDVITTRVESVAAETVASAMAERPGGEVFVASTGVATGPETPSPSQQDASLARPYRSSFIDRFIDFVMRLPGPYWLTFLVLFIVQSAIAHILAWIDGWLTAYTFNPVLLLFPVWIWAPLAIITYLNSVSLEVLSSFSPLLGVDKQMLERLKGEFTTMPARGVALSGAIWAVVYVILTYVSFDAVYVSYGFKTFFSLFVFLEGLAAFSTGSVIYYHSLRQLALVNRTVKMVQNVNLFQLEPVYAFSRLTARTGVSWMIMLSLTLVLYPSQLTNAPQLALLFMQVVLALGAFALPLRMVNDRLVSEKRRLIAELDRRVERTLERLHRCLDDDEMREMDQLNDAVAALNAERDILTRIPTWPWRAGTLTSFLSAVGLPIVLFLIQLVITRWFGG